MDMVKKMNYESGIMNYEQKIMERFFANHDS